MCAPTTIFKCTLFNGTVSYQFAANTIASIEDANISAEPMVQPRKYRYNIKPTWTHSCPKNEAARVEFNFDKELKARAKYGAGAIREHYAKLTAIP